jgi:hypothetical protein
MRAMQTIPSNPMMKRLPQRFLRFVVLAACIAITPVLVRAQTVFTHDRAGYLRASGPASNGLPVVVGQPRSQVAPVGFDLSFAVVAVGSQPLQYQWQRNSNDIPGAVADTLLLTNIAPADFGAYRVVVSNALGSVASSNAWLQLDSDRDGMADAWETNYFTSITNRSGFEDYDVDGVSDRDEFIEGTHPRFSSVVNPRLTIISDRGEVFVTPNAPLFTNGQTVTLTGIPDPGLEFLGYMANAPSYAIIAIRTNPAQIRLTSPQTVRAIFGLPISQSLDVAAAGRIDQVGWFGQTNVTHDGVDAMQSARMLGQPAAWLELTNVVLASEGTITFWWKIDGTPVDTLLFYRNNVFRPGGIQGNTDWQLRTYYLPAGTNVVRWAYDKNRDEVSEYNGLLYAPLDAAWVDEVTYAVWPDPARDADGDGLRDIWELRYFDSTAVAANADADNDGISNLDEHIDGTDPTSNASFLPRLTVVASGGSVVRNPDLPKYMLGQTVQLQAIPEPDNYFVSWSGAISGTNMTNSVLMNRNQTVLAVFGLPLPVVLETPDLAWTRGGAIGWYGQTNVSRDGVDAAQSGPVGFRQESSMETSVTGPGTLTYWWKTLSSTNQSFARFHIDGVEQPGRISGATGWRVESFAIAPGPHTLRWVYSNNTAIVSLTNGAWVDQVTFTNSSIAPVVHEEPQDTVVLQERETAFTVAAAGTPPLHYRWFRNGISVGNTITNATLRLLNVAPSQAGNYSVQVSNAVGVVVSGSATLTVLPVPPANDDFADRSPAATGVAVPGYTFGATSEFGETNHAGLFGYSSIWWSWTAPASGRYQARAFGTNIFSPLVIGIYHGNAVNALTPVASGVGTEVITNGVRIGRVTTSFNAIAGQAYALALDHSGNPSFVTLVIAPVSAPVAGSAAVSAGGKFGFSFAPGAGAEYIIEASDDLEVWTVIASGTAPLSGVVQFEDPAHPLGLHRFYRVLLPP